MIKLYPENKKKLTAITWILRILVGAVFVFSGFVKLIDPWGSLLKFEEYFILWGIDMPRQIVLFGAVGLSLVEFTSGISLAIGAFRHTTTIILTALMTIMTALTVYIFLYNPVSDCGCFGDAVILSNSNTLIKNIILLISIIYLLVVNHRVNGIVKPKVQWMATVFTIAYGGIIAYIGYSVQPLIDFRPFPVGTNFKTVINEDVDDCNITFIYEKDGVTKEFKADEIPDDSWTFIERNSQGSNPHKDATSLVLYDEDGQDATLQAIDTIGSELVLIVSEPEKYGLSRAAKTNRLAETIERNGGRLTAWIASNYKGGIEKWKELTNAEYDVYQADDTDLKMIVRGEAGLIYIKDGTVSWKRQVYSLPPDIDDEYKSNPQLLSQIKPIEDTGTLMWLTIGYILSMLLVYCMGVVLPKVVRTAGKTSQENKI